MGEHSFLYVANWKMQLNYRQALEFCQKNKEGFSKLAGAEDSEIILCPSFDVLHTVAQLFKDSNVIIGAQTCSSHVPGAYTGEVSAQSLDQIGCRYCIVGHSERRLYCTETDQDIAHKIERLLDRGIIPLVCVGETRGQFERKETETVIKRQVSSAFKAAQGAPQFCIAYEPIWAIGTGDVPTNDSVQSVFEQINMLAHAIIPDVQIALLYGGSINDSNAADLKKIQGIGGFLIGGASLDFQKFEKIVT